MLLTVSQSMIMPHHHQPSKESITSSNTYLDTHTAPICTPMALMALPPMTSINRLPQATYTPKRYPMDLLILQMVEKATPPMKNAPSPASSSVFLALMFIGQPKPNQLCSPLHILWIPHLLSCHQNGPISPTHTKKTWIPRLLCSNFCLWV